MIADVVINVRTKTGLNAREHHMARHNRVKKERAATSLSLHAYTDVAALRAQRLVRVLFVRVSPQLADDDNLAGSMKHVRDEVAKVLGVSDAPGKGIKWEYDQVRGAKGQHCVRLTIETSEESRPVETVANDQRRP